MRIEELFIDGSVPSHPNQLGFLRGRLKDYADEVKGLLFDTDGLLKSIDEIYRYPLRESAVDSLNRQLLEGEALHSAGIYEEDWGIGIDLAGC